MQTRPKLVNIIFCMKFTTSLQRLYTRVALWNSQHIFTFRLLFTTSLHVLNKPTLFNFLPFVWHLQQAYTCCIQEWRYQMSQHLRIKEENNLLALNFYGSLMNLFYKIIKCPNYLSIKIFTKLTDEVCFMKADNLCLKKNIT